MCFLIRRSAPLCSALLSLAVIIIVAVVHWGKKEKDRERISKIQFVQPFILPRHNTCRVTKMNRIYLTRLYHRIINEG